jgi:hypothetical protein
VSADSLGGWLEQPSGTEQAFPLLAVARVERRAGEQPGNRGGDGSAHGSGGNAALGMAIGGALGAIGPVIAYASCDHDKPSSGAYACEIAIYGLVVTVPLGMLLGALFGAASGNE